MKLCKEGNGKKEKEKDFWSNGPGGIRPSQLRRVGGRARMRAAQSAHKARTTLGGVNHAATVHRWFPAGAPVLMQRAGP